MVFMKLLVKKILMCIIWIVSKIYPYSLSLQIHDIRDLLYSMWVSHFVCEFGDNSLIGYPCSLHGDRKRLSIGTHVYIGKQTVIEPICKYGGQKLPSKIVIGNYCTIGEFNHITAVNNIIIGDGLLTGRRVLLSNNNHGDFSKDDLKVRPAERRITSKGDLVIENNVWIGEGASVLGSLRIGEGSVIAANSVVTKDVPSYTLVAGVPARIIKSLKENSLSDAAMVANVLIDKIVKPNTQK